MDPILNALYTAMKSDRMSQEEAAIMKREKDFLAQMNSQLSRKEYDRFWGTALEIGILEAEESFSLGFRLGVQLILSALQPLPTKDKL